MRNSELAQVLLSLSQPEARLYPWQEKWLDDTSRFRILLKSRAVGGSFLIALESLLNALLTPGSTILLFSYSLRQSVELFRKIRNHVARWKNARVKHDDVVYVFPEALETKTTLEFPNESRIIALPNNPEAVRGYRADVVYVDEAAMFKDDFALKAAVI
ncbi:MAG: terminase large subunit, partial [Candidatus Caldarchaeum sp.]